MNLVEQVALFKHSKQSKAVDRLLEEGDKTKLNELETENTKKSKKRQQLRFKLSNESDHKHKKINRINLFGYESISEEPTSVIKKLSPKSTEQPNSKTTAKPALKSLIKKPTLKSLKLSEEKKSIEFKQENKEEVEKPKNVTDNNDFIALTTDTSRDSKLTFSSSLSEDANYCMLKTYEDMLYFDLKTIYPDVTHSLTRTKTENFIQIPRKLPAKLAPLNDNYSYKQQPEVKVHQTKISEHLEKAMLISDIIKKTKGELTTTTNKPVKLNNLLGAFEEWKSNWQTMCRT